MARRASRKSKPKGKYKSAITGRYVTSAYGKRHPRTTMKVSK